MSALTLRVVPGAYAVCRLAPDAALPAWAAGATGFSSITRTADELSVICAESAVPADVKSERGWALLQFVGPFDFGAVGVLASVAQPLAAAQISLLALGTFDTDYVLVKHTSLPAARDVLLAAGHRVVSA
ncbi:MAG: ACT domain-containing protein [Verrucomicrobia bacterium]|nr:ACT domain-containing protein [Verrucomicrobiota bacterium]